MEGISSEQMAAMRAAVNAPAAPVQETVVIQEPVVEVVTPEVVTPTPEPVIEKPVVETTPAPEVKVKTFEDELAERFEGKFKSADEIKAALNAPKEVWIDDEEVKNIYELKKKGVKIDKEFFELQSLNLEPDSKGEIDTSYVLLEALKRKPETQGYDSEMLQGYIDKKYNLSEWKDKDESDLTVDDKINRANMTRDAREGFDWLKALKQERTFVKPVDENLVKQQNDDRELGFRKFDELVDKDVVAKVTNLSTIIDDKTGEKFEFKISDADGKEFGSLMKSLARGEKNLFDQFAYTDEKGVKQFNHQKVFEMLVKNKNYEQAVKNAFNDGKALGAKKEITELKNSGFPVTETKSKSTEPQTPEEAKKAALRKQNGLQ